MDLYLLNELNKLESGGTGGGGGATGCFLPDNLNADGSVETAGSMTWAAVTRHSNRGQADNWRWTSSSPYTTWYAYMNNQYDAEWAMSFAGNKVADFYNRNNFGSFDTGSKSKMVFGNGRFVGTAGITHGKDGASYSPFTTSVMFVKNPTASNINATVYNRYTNYWNAGYEGAGLQIGTPNHTDKASVSSLSWSSRWTATSNTSGTQNSASCTFPANKTCVLVHTSTDWYWTGTTYNHYWSSMNGFYNLQVLRNAGLECDLELTQTFYQGRSGGNSTYLNNYRWWNECAKNFPPETA